MSITPSVAVDTRVQSSMPISDKSVIMVDDEGDGDYTSIKDALNHSNPGDTIEVYSGTFYKYNINIKIEEITLKGIPYELGNGSDTGKPLIHGQGKSKVMRIWAQGFTITGFRIENGGGTIACGFIGTWKGADNCVISYDDIAHAITGCVGIISNNNKILNNTISHSAIRRGIALGEECKNNIISGNVISDVETGILFWDSNHNPGNFTEEELIEYTTIAFKTFNFRLSHMLRQLYKILSRKEYSLLINNIKFFFLFNKMSKIGKEPIKSKNITL